MIKIEINSFTNGSSLTVFDTEDGYIVREVAKSKLEVLKTLLDVIIDLAAKERKQLEAAL